MDYQLSPQLLQQLYGLGPNQTLDSGGMTYFPVGVGGTGGEDQTAFTPQGYAAFTQGTALKPGAKGVEYGPNGNGYTGYQLQNGSTPDKQMLMAALAFAGGVGALGGFGGAFAGAGDAGAAGAIDPTLAVQGNSINALDAATGVPYGSEVGAGLGTGAAGAGAADAAMTAPGIMGPSASGSAFNTALTDAGLGSGAAGGLGGLGGLGSSLGGLSGLGGLIAPALGALAGSQPQKTTQQQDIPEWLKPYVIGTADNPGLLGRTNSLLQMQSAPGYMQGYDQMRSLGQSLMGTPAVGNGFTRFFGGGNTLPGAPTTAPTGLLSGARKH